MGAQLCGLRRSGREEEDQHDEFRNLSQSSLAELLLSSPCSRDDIKNKRASSSNESMDQNGAKARKLTLEEWMVASPARPNNGTIGSGQRVFKSFTRIVFPTSLAAHHEAGTGLDSREGRNSSSIDIFPETGTDVPTGSGGKAKKRVSFRSPQVADIIFLYSPAREIQRIQGSTIMMRLDKFMT